jgi:uncharacterized protein
MKFLLLGVILIFRKKSKVVENSKNSNKEISADEFIPCEKCETLVSEKEAIIVDGKFYCSKECGGVK